MASTVGGVGDRDSAVPSEKVSTPAVYPVRRLGVTSNLQHLFTTQRKLNLVLFSADQEPYMDGIKDSNTPGEVKYDPDTMS